MNRAENDSFLAAERDSVFSAGNTAQLVRNFHGLNDGKSEEELASVGLYESAENNFDRNSRELLVA